MSEQEIPVDDFEEEDEGSLHDALSAAFDDADDVSTITDDPVVAAPTTEAAAPALADHATEETGPPASWNPTAREAWANIPAAVQTEIARREQEMQKGLNETTQARQLSSSFTQLVTPFNTLFQAQGMNAFEGIQDSLQVAAQLQMGTPQQKAQVAAQIIQRFGIDIAQLDDLLVGNMPAKVAPNPELDAVKQQMQQMQQYIQQQNQMTQQQKQQQQQQINQSTESFLKETPYAGDLRMVMADFMDFADRNGQSIDLKTAYDRALATRPDIQQLIQNKAKATNSATALAGARRANSSVPLGNNGAGSRPAPANMREALSDAWDNGS